MLAQPRVCSSTGAVAGRVPSGSRSAAAEPSRFASTPSGAALFRPKVAESQPQPQRDRVPSEAAERRRRRVGLFIGGALIAIGLVAGTAFIGMQSERSVAALPIIDTTPAKAVPGDMPADNDKRSKPISDRVDGADSADTMKLVTPAAGKVAASPPSFGDDNKPISQIDGGLPPGASPAVPHPPVPRLTRDPALPPARRRWGATRRLAPHQQAPHLRRATCPRAMLPVPPPLRTMVGQAPTVGQA